MVLFEVDFEFLFLFGLNIDEYFRNIVEEQSRLYFEKVQMLVDVILFVILDEWSYFVGWIKYVYIDEGLVILFVDVL